MRHLDRSSRLLPSGSPLHVADRESVSHTDGGLNIEPNIVEVVGPTCAVSAGLAKKNRSQSRERKGFAIASARTTAAHLVSCTVRAFSFLVSRKRTTRRARSTCSTRSPVISAERMRISIAISNIQRSIGFEWRLIASRRRFSSSDPRRLSLPLPGLGFRILATGF